MTARRAKRLKPRGRILRLRPGYNPNSSSLGVDLTLMLLGSLMLSITVTLVSTFVRLKASAVRERLATGVPGAPDGSPPAP